MLLSQLIAYLERLAPPAYQESYDNSGLIAGSPALEVKGVLTCLDATEAVIEEAIAQGCNVVVAHHPIVFSGLKSLTGKNYVERTIISAIKNEIAIYAIHTNLDNMHTGVNARIASQLGLENVAILVPKKQILRQLSTYVPVMHSESVRNALFEAGAGKIGNYSETSFNMIGAGSFKGNDDSNAFVGAKNERHFEAETKIEVIYEVHNEKRVLTALRNSHPYEEIAYNIISLENEHKNIGAGMIGDLPTAMPVADFLETVKLKMQAGVVRHTALIKDTVQRVAVCGGSGSFLLRHAIAQKADVFVTADFKYHEFFDAENKIVIADIGHFESEQYTIDLLQEKISSEWRDLHVVATTVRTNPVFYL